MCVGASAAILPFRETGGSRRAELDMVRRDGPHPDLSWEKEGAVEGIGPRTLEPQYKSARLPDPRELEARTPIRRPLRGALIGIGGPKCNRRDRALFDNLGILPDNNPSTQV